MKTSLKDKIASIKIHILLLIILIVTVAPFVWMLSTSLKEPGDIFTETPEWLPPHPTLDNYVELFTTVDFGTNTLNSVIVSSSVTVLVIFINSLAGFAFAKYRFPGRERLFVLLLATMMVPGQVCMMPVFMLLKYMGLLNTFTGLVLPGSASVFAIFLMRQFMMGIPDDLLEAARIDGCSEFRIYSRIMLPLCKPAIATLAIFTFMGSWNEFLWALIVMLDESKYTLPVALANLSGQHATDWGLLMAGSVVVILPVLVIFLIMQRHYIKGIATAGLK